MSNYQEDLFNKLLNGNLSPGELETLIAWLGSEKIDQNAADLITRQLKQKINSEQLKPEVRAALEARLPLIIGNTEKHNVFQMQWLRYAAAVIIIMLGIAAFLLLNKKSVDKKIANNSIQNTLLKNDVAPGKDGAILTLADGRTVVLDSMGNGIVATQNGSKILLKNGQLLYNKDNLLAADAVYNTISTPRGRQFQVLLSDGTRVWLNAASSLRYPIVFTGKERDVEVTGEAYFEVAKNASMPFRVKINDQTQIEVLGTHFNINSYDNESSINTTLLEGSVKVSHNGETTIIKPGQQAQIGHEQSKINVLNDVNVEKVIAWKNGVFDFQDATLEEVMRQLERWYDVDVTYEKSIPRLEFIGKMQRDLTLSNVLRGLEMSKVHARLEGRKLIVLP